jgi:hypothetical protein
VPTQYDFYEALREGRWKPEIKLSEDKNEYVAKYTQGDLSVEKRSKWSVTQAEGDLMEELAQGTLEGKYFPTD